MSIVSIPRPGAAGVPIVVEVAVDPPVLPAGEPADPPIEFRLEDEDGVHLWYAPPPPPVNYIPPAPSLRWEDREPRRVDGEETDSLDGSSHLHLRRPQPRVGALAPMLAPHQLPLVTALKDDLVRETAGRGLFSAFADEDSHTAAMTFVRYRLSALAIIRQRGRDARRIFLPDLRELGRKAFPEMQLLMQLLAHFAPVQKRRVNPKGPTFEEVVLPAKLRGYKADFICLGGFIKPNQTMANYVSKGMIPKNRTCNFPAELDRGWGKHHLVSPSCFG